MTAQLIDGKAVATAIHEEVRAGAAAFKAKYGYAPGLATVLVGDDPASHSYVKGKRQACADDGIDSFPHELPAAISQEEVIALVPLMLIVTARSRLSQYCRPLAGTAGDTDLFVLSGAEPGATVLVLGGTHGDEPAGYVAAVMLVERARVVRGRLIVIPRANASGFTHNVPQEGHPQRFTVQTPRPSRTNWTSSYGCRCGPGPRPGAALRRKTEIPTSPLSAPTNSATVAVRPWGAVISGPAHGEASPAMILPPRALPCRR